MKISQLWIYPIKSLRGCSVPQAMLTREGFYLDRRFMLLKVHPAPNPKLENMAISSFPSMSLFHPTISLETEILSIRYRTPGTSEPSEDALEIPLEPETKGLRELKVEMHGSGSTAFNMGEKANKWFSERFGFEVILAYWGGNPRLVLGNLPGKDPRVGPKSKNVVTKAISKVPIVGSIVNTDDDEVLAFNDCAPYLVITEKSAEDVSSRLPGDMEMDITKFRSNIVVTGSERAYEEDLWGELKFGKNSDIILTANCGRCKSLNVDYKTGRPGTGKDGEILKLMQKDRRIDLGTKYSSCFGRYGFASRNSEGKILRVGDEVSLSKQNREGTRFYWPGVSTD
ncbi:MOSC N-terminal beta barrel domain-containing protein [Tricladium varicosporioides]|nr:MOSC N-terminal beta barrel domain-containing protein [Hymenoscyphus varicosporioides]